MSFCFVLLNLPVEQAAAIKKHAVQNHVTFLGASHSRYITHEAHDMFNVHHTQCASHVQEHHNQKCITRSKCITFKVHHIRCVTQAKGSTAVSTGLSCTQSAARCNQCVLHRVHLPTVQPDLVHFTQQQSAAECINFARLVRFVYARLITVKLQWSSRVWFGTTRSVGGPDPDF